MELHQEFTEELLSPGEKVSLNMTVTEPDGEELTDEQANHFWAMPRGLFGSLANQLKDWCLTERAQDAQTFSHEAIYRTPTATVTYRLDITAPLDPDDILCTLGRVLHPLHEAPHALDIVRHPESFNPFAGTPLEGLIDALRESGVELDVQMVGAGDLGATHADSAPPNIGLYL